MTEKKLSRAKRKALRPTMYWLNRQTRPHNPGPARRVGRGFLRRATVKPWGGPQGQRGRNRGRNHTEGSIPPLGFRQVIVPGQAVVFPVFVRNIGERQWNNGWTRVGFSAISEITNCGKRAQRIPSAGLFCFDRILSQTVRAGSSHSQISNQSGGIRLIERAPRAGAGVGPNVANVVGKNIAIWPQRGRVPSAFAAREGTEGVVHADAPFGIVNPPNPPPHRIHFFYPNTARNPREVAHSRHPRPHGARVQWFLTPTRPDGASHENQMKKYAKKFPTMQQNRRCSYV